jgi:hypothetical protein
MDTVGHIIRLLPVLSTLLLHTSTVAHCDDEVDREADDSRLVLVVVGASGTAEYGRLFDTWAGRWMDAARQGGVTAVLIGSSADDAKTSKRTDREQLRQRLASFRDTTAHADVAELWIVLLGHGTYDGRLARFNLRGPDVSASDLQEWLNDIECPTVIANCASASAPFMQKLAAHNRVIITATKSGAEQNFARFGEYLSRAIGDASLDLDKDGQTSVFEAYLSASRQTDQFYESEGRLATEHSLLDDNGDAQGIRADWFRGIRPVKKPKGTEAVDGRRAHQLHLVRSATEQSLPSDLRRRRDALELAVIQLRDRAPQFENEDDYYAQLEQLLIQLARVYEQAAPVPESIGQTLKAQSDAVIGRRLR